MNGQTRHRLLYPLLPFGTRGPEGPLAVLTRRYSWAAPLVAMTGLLAGLFEALAITMLVPLVAMMMGQPIDEGLPRPLAELANGVVPSDGGMSLFAAALAILALFGLKSGFQTVNLTLIGRIDSGLGHDVRTALASRLLDVDYAFYLAHDSARTVKIMTTDAWYALDIVRCGLTVLTSGLFLAIFAAMMLWLDWRLFLLAGLGFCLVRLIQSLLERHLRGLGEAKTGLDERLAGRMMVLVQAFRPIRLFRQEPRELERFAHASDAMRAQMYRIERWSAIMPSAMEFLMAAVIVLVLGYAQAADLGLPLVSAFLVLLYRTQPYMRTIGSSRLRMAAVRGSVTEVEWLLGQKPARPVGDAGRVPDFDAPIRFVDVSYGYAGGENAVESVSFTLHPGAATALVGHSGAGKSTVVNLLCRLVEPSGGALMLGDRPANSIAPDAWLSRIAVAGQDVELIDGTIAENIAYGCPEATCEEIVEAARAAWAHGFIADQPGGYDTQVGSGGLSLSGGQRQRIGLARALLARPDLLILDEATSAIDAVSEAEIVDLLKRRSHFRSALVISHRQSTLRACENGVVLEAGRVIAAGPLSDLAYWREMAVEETG